MNTIHWLALAAGLAALSGCVADPTYTRCNTGADCEVSEQCLQVTTAVTNGSFCTNECAYDTDCESNLGFAGSCMNADGLGGICFQECAYDSDCFSTSVCVEFEDVDGFVNYVCLPSR